MNRETAEQFMDNILGSTDVQEILLINRRRVNALVEVGKLKPIKQLKRENLFWLADVIALKNEMMKDTRTNLYKEGMN